MSNPKSADAQPIPQGIIAAVDETVIELQGGVTYVLVAAVFCEPQAALQDIRNLTADRKRPLHWHKEGPKIRRKAVALIEKHVITATVFARRAGRRSQPGARAAILTVLAAKLAAEGIAHVVIESRGPRDDGRDRSAILDCFRESGTMNTAFTYDWRTKAEPLLGYPDALAGVAREYLTRGRSEDFSQLQRASIVPDVKYV